MKVARRRVALYPLHTKHITLGSAYSDTAAVPSCSRRGQYTSWIATNRTKDLSSDTAMLQLYSM